MDEAALRALRELAASVSGSWSQGDLEEEAVLDSRYGVRFRVLPVGADPDLVRYLAAADPATVLELAERLLAAEAFARHDPGVAWPRGPHRAPEAAVMAALDEARERAPRPESLAQARSLVARARKNAIRAGRMDEARELEQALVLTGEHLLEPLDEGGR